MKNVLPDLPLSSVNDGTRNNNIDPGGFRFLAVRWHFIWPQVKSTHSPAHYPIRKTAQKTEYSFRLLPVCCTQTQHFLEPTINNYAIKYLPWWNFISSSGIMLKETTDTIVSITGTEVNFECLSVCVSVCVCVRVCVCVCMCVCVCVCFSCV